MFLHKTNEYGGEKHHSISREILIIKIDLLGNSLLEEMKFTLADRNHHFSWSEISFSTI